MSNNQEILHILPLKAFSIKRYFCFRVVHFSRDVKRFQCFAFWEENKYYIAKQEVHHRKLSFEEEFRALCQKHGLEIDERYVWE